MNENGLNFQQLVNATFTPHAKALGAMTSHKTYDVNGKAKDAATEGFSLPVQDLGEIAERMNMDNPLEFFYSTLQVDSSGSGSVQIEYEIFNDVWTKKNGYFTETGLPNAKGWGYQLDSDGTGIDMSKIREKKEMHKEVFFWNDSQIKGGGLLAADKARGMPATFLQRNQRALKKFSQNSVKDGFKFLTGPKEGYVAFTPATIKEDGTSMRAWDYKTKKVVVPKVYLPYEVYTPETGATLTDMTLQEQGARLYKTLVDAATTFYIENERDPSEVQIVINPLKFNLLAMAGLLGDKVTKTFSGGQYQVSTISEFTIKSGGMYLPKEVKVYIPHKDGKYVKDNGDLLDISDATAVDAAAKTVPLVAMMGTSDCMIHQKDIIAMNAGRIGNTSDLETYTELTDITAVPDRTYREGLLKLVVQATTDVTADPVAETIDTETVNIELDDEDSK